MLKKITLILLTSLLLFSCWEDENKQAENTKNTTQVGLRFFPWEDFTMNIPAAWNIITDNKNILEKPSNWKVELAITSPDTKNGFSNNLIILSQFLKEKSNSKDYSILNNIWAERKYLNYYKKYWKDFLFDDWKKSMIYNFEAKYSEETPMLTFLQTAYICKNNKAFFITIALPLDIKNVSKYEKMIASFKCK